MKRIEKLLEFQKHVGVLKCDDFDFLKIVPDSKCGFFDPPSSDRLIRFCETNPDFHIVTIAENNVYLNFYVPNKIYLLANGDPDPELYHAERVSLEEYLELRCSELWIKELVAIRYNRV